METSELEQELSTPDYVKEYHEIPALREDKEITLKVVKKIGTFLEYASERLKNDREVVMTAITSEAEGLISPWEILNGKALLFASDELRSDREFMIEVLQKNPNALEYATDELKNDKDIVTEVVESCGFALKYASDELKNDKEVVLKAVKNNGVALEFASERLRDDKEIIIEAWRSLRECFD